MPMSTFAASCKDIFKKTVNGCIAKVASGKVPRPAKSASARENHGEDKICPAGRHSTCCARDEEMG